MNKSNTFLKKPRDRYALLSLSLKNSDNSLTKIEDFLKKLIQFCYLSSKNTQNHVDEYVSC